jgi:6-phosphofructokinase
MTTAAEALDKIHTTAQSHHRVMIVEIMGRYAGWLALASGLAGGGDIILIPEIPYDLNEICNQIKDRNRQSKNFSIIVIGEGAKSKGGEMVVKRTVETSPDAIRLGGISQQLAQQIEERVHLETRVTILGHLVRGGSPTPYDRLLATHFGCQGVHLAAQKQFGRMVALKGTVITSVPLEEVAGKVRHVPLDSYLVKSALSTGVSLGVTTEEIQRLIDQLTPTPELA